MDKSTYESQFFGFTPTAFCDAVYNVMFDAASDTVNSFHKVLKEEWPALASDEELNQSSLNLRNEIGGIQDKISDKLEVYLRTNVLSIPSGILLPEDEAHRADVEPDTALDEEIQELLAEINKVDSHILRANKELERIDELEKLAARYRDGPHGSKSEAQKVNELVKLNTSKLERLFKNFTETDTAAKPED